MRWDPLDKKSILEKEEMSNIIYILEKAELVISSLKNEAGELIEFLRFGSKPESKDSTSVVDEKNESLSLAQVELFIPGSVYFIKKTMKTENGKASEILLY